MDLLLEAGADVTTVVTRSISPKPSSIRAGCFAHICSTMPQWYNGDGITMYQNVIKALLQAGASPNTVIKLRDLGYHDTEFLSAHLINSYRPAQLGDWSQKENKASRATTPATMICHYRHFENGEYVLGRYRLEILKLLIAAGAELNPPNARPPLFELVQSFAFRGTSYSLDDVDNQLRLVDLLVRSGADIEDSKIRMRGHLHDQPSLSEPKPPEGPERNRREHLEETKLSLQIMKIMLDVMKEEAPFELKRSKFFGKLWSFMEPYRSGDYAYARWRYSDRWPRIEPR